MLKKYIFEALGTHFSISIWDAISETVFQELMGTAETRVHAFDQLYSRFLPDSLITQLSTKTGSFEVPADLVAMLRLYEKINIATGGKINPCIGYALSDAGYDAAYSFVESDMRTTPALGHAVEILDDTHIKLNERVLLDLGALGKGFIIDRVFDHLVAAGVRRFLVDGSGDIRYQSDAEPIVCGLEHPLDPKLAIGTLQISGGSLCASATNRRSWAPGRNHYIDPDTGQSPSDIIATWVYAQDAALADGIASALFFSPAGSLHAFAFEYLTLSQSLVPKSSAGFLAELF